MVNLVQFMGENSVKQVQEIVDEVYRSESRRVFATLVRLVGDFDLAEEAKRVRSQNIAAGMKGISDILYGISTQFLRGFIMWNLG